MTAFAGKAGPLISPIRSKDNRVRCGIFAGWFIADTLSKTQLPNDLASLTLTWKATTLGRSVGLGSHNYPPVLSIVRKVTLTPSTHQTSARPETLPVGPSQTARTKSLDGRANGELCP